MDAPNPSRTTALKRINEILAPLDDRQTAGFYSPRQPVVFVVESGRCGSTLVTQVLASQLHLGYVSNLMARFWRAPYLGALLERRFIPRFLDSAFQSQYGNTRGGAEPHEWGWFWRHWLHLTDDETHCRAESLDFAGLLRKLAAIESVKGVPLFFDNAYAAANIDHLRRRLSRVLVLRLTRDPYYVCNSHINARIRRHGNVRVWYGARPRNFAELLRIDDPIEQVVAQVKSLTDEAETDVARFDSANVLRIDYAHVIADPQAVARRYAAFMSAHGCDVEFRDPLPTIPLRNNNTVEHLNPDHRDALDRHFAAYFPSVQR